ncbi:hypothetical protein [Microbacterium aurantiacum]|uniref:Type IV secretion protein Rhs n=1 Tax=Microbacterium aurantiacum TaxID=162393 RepID=A0ABT8FPR0_9MICO|nr:hypothetical protein [Microbacterium aurantiacum]MBN9202323.1 hypothetical protein [Microbacterium chocolatum]MDN4462847.1 hypothetical protein [Microbacterium aurantiacum]ODT11289.1 MAG: hypothetical protein ABS61_03945 [Microbacterium sp. SCN 70-18]
MRRDKKEEGEQPSLRDRVKAAGGWYAYVNARLIQVAGPASVGPYETTPPPSAEVRAERACPLCGHPVSAHTFDRSGPKPLMYCP